MTIRCRVRSGFFQRFHPGVTSLILARMEASSSMKRNQDIFFHLEVSVADDLYNLIWYNVL